MPEATKDFFDTPREGSKVKAQIVFKYAQTWGRILSDHLRKKGESPEVVFLDLFSGPGVYGDGTPSTPMLLLKAAAEDPKLGTALHTYFNDNDSDNIRTLREAIADLPGIAELRFQPTLSSKDVSLAYIESLGLPRGMPKLYFLDQFGYKHVTFALVQALLASWAECIFFFNYRRARSAIDNPAMLQNVTNLFGNNASLGALKSALLLEKSTNGAEELVMSHLVEAFKDAGAKHVLPFPFKSEGDSLSTHHLIFLSNNDKGYTKMKEIMAKEGTKSADGVPYLAYIENEYPQTMNMFEVSPFIGLGAELCLRFAGQTMTVQEVFIRHSPGTKFLPVHYQDALLKLEAEKRILTSPSSGKRPKPKGIQTMALGTRITFAGGAL